MYGPLILFLFTVSQTNAEYDPLVDSLKAITIPEKLQGISAKVVVKSSRCSSTCGVGTKTEKRCMIDKYNKRRKCEEVVVKCVIAFLCGMHTYTLTAGENFSINCLSKRNSDVQKDIKYYWQLSRGILTTDDNLFRPLKIFNYLIEFSPIKEKDAGTYRCDIQDISSSFLVKRIYFGIKVLSPDLLDLNFEKFVISKSDLKVLEKEELNNLKSNHTLNNISMYGRNMYIILGVGCGGGILGGILLAVALLRPSNITSKEDDEV
ncbi:transmembrane protein 81 [Pelobates fuscus]|uniref:transmembrane protein 81 n=1 Tax=Pelobates fuscus TaxID=191477 RepID=UPI002FE44853